MTVGLSHVAAAAAFVIVTNHTVAQSPDVTSSTTLSSIDECFDEFLDPCLNDATCSECFNADITQVNECTDAIGYNGLDQCVWQTGNFCCFSEVSGEDCLANDAFWALNRCGFDQTCDTRTCDGITEGGTSPTPSTTTTPAPGTASSLTEVSATDCVAAAVLACNEDATCSVCFNDISGDPALSDCLRAIDYSETCDTKRAFICCFNEVSGEDCIGNDAFWEFVQCPGLALTSDPTCETRTCDGAPAGGGTSPAPAVVPTSPAPAAAGAETVAPSATTAATAVSAAGGVESVPPFVAIDATVAPAEADSMTAAPSSATGTQTPVSSSEDTLEPTFAAESVGGDLDGGATLEPTSTAERAISITAAPTTAGEAEDTDASGTSGAGLGVSLSPVGLVVAGLVAVVAAVGVLFDRSTLGCN